MGSSRTSKAKWQQPKPPPWEAPRSPSSSSSLQQPTLSSNSSSSNSKRPTTRTWALVILLVSQLPMLPLLKLAILGHLLHTQLRPPILHRIQPYLPNTNLTFHFSFYTFEIYALHNE